MPTLACPSATTAAIVAAAPPRNYRPDFPRVRIQKLDAPDATRLAYYNELQGKVLPGLVKAGMRPRHSYSRRRSRVWRILVLSSSRRRRISRIRFQAIFFLALSASSMSRTWQRWITARQASWRSKEYAVYIHLRGFRDDRGNRRPTWSLLRESDSIAGRRDPADLGSLLLRWGRGMTRGTHLAWTIEESKEGEEMGYRGVGNHLGRGVGSLAQPQGLILFYFF